MREETSSTSKVLILVILVALIVCFVAILIWINAIGNKRERAVEALKSTITPVNTPTPIVRMSEEDLSVESVAVTVPEKSLEVKVDEPVSKPSEPIANYNPSVAYAVTNPTSVFQSVQPVLFEKYTVKENDTLATIAEARKLRTQTLVSVNSLKTVYPAVGSVLVIPNQDGQFYTVKEGDTFFSIAQRFSLSISWKTLKEINGLDEENIKVGMLLFIPYDTPSMTETEVVSSYVEDTTFASPLFEAYVYGKYDQKVINPISDEVEFLDGVLLQTISSSVVKVSEEGFVVDKGVNEINRTWFVKVSHANGYTSYYDYLNTTNIEIGQKIKKGEIIGQINEGNTNLGTPTLFFRVEQDGISLDPSLFF